MALTNSTIANGAALQVFPPAGGDGALPTNNYAVLGVGSFVANSTSAVTVADAGVTASSIISITMATPGGTPSAPYLTTITPGTGFTIKAGASDTSTYNYLRIG